MKMRQDQLAGWFPKYDADLKQVRQFWGGDGRCMVSLYPAGNAYRQVFDDDRVLAAVPGQLKAQGALPGISIPTFWADYGTISTAKYWGCQSRFDSTGGNIFVDPLAQTIEATEALSPCPVDHPEQDGARALRLYRALSTSLQTDRLWLRSPDMQGPLNTAGMVMNQEELFMAMYESPDKVHAYLSRVTDFLIQYARYLRDGTGNRIIGNIWPYTAFPSELGVAFTEDIMPLISAEMYAEFGIPCLRRLADALGGLHIHCCGEYGRHVPALAASGLPIRAIEFHYPFTRVEELLPLAEQGTVLIPYFNEEHGRADYPDTYAYYRDLLRRSSPGTRYWFALVDDSAAARTFAAELEFRV